MKIGIIGAGLIGGTLTRRLSKLGHKVFIANSRGPASLADLAAETSATAVTVHEAARSSEIVFVTIPGWKIPDLPKNLFDGVSPDVVVVDTGNYYARERDGRIDAIEEGMAESHWVASRFGRPVLKAINNLHWRSLLNDGKSMGTPGRIALPVQATMRPTKPKSSGSSTNSDLTALTLVSLTSLGVNSLARRCTLPISMQKASVEHFP